MDGDQLHMLNEYKEEWIAPSLPEPVEEPVYLPVRTTAALRRKCFSLLILFFTILMLIVAQNNQLLQTSYRLVEMKQQIAELEKENQTLRVDIAKLKSTERIGEIATNQLGLVMPDAKYISTAQ